MYPNCVRAIDWQFIAISKKGKNEAGEPLTVTLHGTATVDVPTVQDSSDYINFDDIQKEWCIDKTLIALKKSEKDLKEIIDAKMLDLEYPKMRKTVPGSWLPDSFGALGAVLGTLASANNIKMPESSQQ